VALGRAGATQRQCLDLGKGTAQHALIAGKTGSGKSTLLHALITNLALLYSPDEVELYLIDFKKGVEFKTYAVHDLPHARVIAIESEREFGLSVLQRLDAELRMRGERFRDVRAQDVNAYRQAVPGERMPRVLLIVDEFQEFFTEDDRISQEAAQLLDRLVRQGRAFGMHVLLGSQTLGGAYTLARSTIDQMAVRIALQCSEADAHLILSDDNSAARLLSRPGEAIYNDANGLVEGNNPFQVVWLGDERREQYLARIQDLTRRHPPKSREASVVFEGNAPADVSRNHFLVQRLSESVTVEAEGRQTQQLAWLGEAMAINDLTAAPFRRHHGSNLLIIGQQEETSLGMLATAVIGLASQMGPGESTRFYVVDGRQADPPTTGPLARLAEVLPRTIRLAGWRGVPAIVSDLNAEVERRQKEAGAAPTLYLVLFGLQRLRDLRRAEDDFSFMRKAEETANPAQQFATLVREGPPLGLHTLMWCDTLNNLQRTLDRSSMRELAMRVVFQMNVSDSSNLIDSPLASKLGLHRALFFNEEDGRLDKFRPYGLPSEAWLQRVQEQFIHRAEEKQSVALPGG
jgi:DNA segregation ATPase FtsK/SpoIIIE, S-DNA-T family